MVHGAGLSSTTAGRSPLVFFTPEPPALLAEPGVHAAFRHLDRRPSGTVGEIGLKSNLRADGHIIPQLALPSLSRQACAQVRMPYRQIHELFADEPLLAWLFQYWEARRAGRPAPDRADIDPIDIDPKVLPYMTLYDIFDGGRRAKLRLIGSMLIPDIGIPDPTDRFVEEFLSPAQAAYFTSITADVFDHQCPIYSEDRHITPEWRHLRVKRLILPLTQGGPAIAQTLGISRHVSYNGPHFDWSSVVDRRDPARHPPRKELVRFRIRDGTLDPITL